MSKARDLADSAQEINILDGKSFLDEDNLASNSATGIASQQSIKAYVDGITTTNITSTGALNSGSITSGFGNIDNGSSTITTTGAITGGSFVIGSADINENDLESIDGITAGTVAASKAVVVNANKDITGFRNLTATGTISGTLSGAIASTTTATTQAESDDSTKVATTAYVVDKITTLIGGAPSTLNDLNELAAAINDDANYNSTLTTALATKLPLAGGTMTGNISHASNFTLDVGGDIILDAGGAEIFFSHGGTPIAKLQNSNGFNIEALVSDADMVFKGNDGGSTITALTLDMSEAGKSTFFANMDIRADDARLLIEEADGTDIVWLGDVTGSGVGGSYLYNHGGTATVQMRADQASTVTHGINLNNTSVPRLTMTSSSGPYGFIEANTVGSVAISADGGNSGSNTNITFKIDDDEKVRLDTSGNVLVGTTDTTPYNNSANATADNGIALGSSGIFSVAKHNDSPIIANRTGSDGGVIKLHKSGVDRGGIGINNGDPYIARASGSGMRWYNGAVVPTNDAGSDSNNTMDLGSSGVRFKHGYFSGNLYGDGSNLTGVSPPTAYNAVGTYVWGYTADTGYVEGDTKGSGIFPAGFIDTARTSANAGYQHGNPSYMTRGGTACSGTWRAMGRSNSDSSYQRPRPTLWVRIS